MSREFAKQLRRNLTPEEWRLWHAVKAKRLAGAKFRRQVPIGPYVADFVCVAARLIVELDGSQHGEERRPMPQGPDTWKSEAIGSCGSGTTR